MATNETLHANASWPTDNIVAFAGHWLIFFAVGAGFNIMALDFGFESNKRVLNSWKTVIMSSATTSFKAWTLIFLLQAYTMFGVQGENVTLVTSDGLRCIQLSSTYWQSACMLGILWQLVFSRGSRLAAAGGKWIIAASPLLFGVAILMLYANTTIMQCFTDLPFFPVRLGFSLNTAWMCATACMRMNLAGSAASLSSDAQMMLAAGVETMVAVNAIWWGLKHMDPVFPISTAWILASTMVAQPWKKLEENWKRPSRLTHFLLLWGRGLAIFCGLIGCYIFAATSSLS